MHERAVHAVEDARRVALLLEGREDEDLAEAQRVRRALEGVGEEVEQAVAREDGVALHGGEQRQHQPAVRRGRCDHDLARSVDEPVAERLHFLEGGDRFGGGERIEV